VLLKLPRVVPTSGGNSHTGVGTLAASTLIVLLSKNACLLLHFSYPPKKNKTLCPLSTQVFFWGYHGGVKITLKNYLKILIKK
jgi:hypothetical protein